MNTLGKVRLQRYLRPTPPEDLRLENPTLLGGPLLPVRVEGTCVLQNIGDIFVNNSSNNTCKVEALGQ